MRKGGWLNFEKRADAPDVNTNPLPNHGNPGVKALNEESFTCVKKRVSEVRRSMTVLFEILSRAGLIPSVHGSSSTLSGIQAR